MSLRRRVTIVFLVVNGLTLLTLLAYVLIQTKRFRGDFERDQSALRDRTVRLIGAILEERTENALAEVLGDDRGRVSGDGGIMLAIGELDFWDGDQIIDEQLDKAVLVRYDAVNTVLFNPRPRFVFEEGLDRNDIRRQIDVSDGVGTFRDEAGRTFLYGKVDLEGPSQWGFYARLGVPEDPSLDPVGTVRTMLLLTIPGTLFLIAFLYLFFNRAVISPLAEMRTAVHRIGAGDFEQPVEVKDKSDELVELATTMNTMMSEIAGYQANLRRMVDDATERFRRAERNLAVGRRLAAMGQLAAGIAHEINNPLGGLMNAVQKLKSAELPEERRTRYSALAQDSVERIRDIVRRVLDARPHKVDVTQVDVGNVVDRAVDLVRHRAKEAEIDLRVDVASDLVVLGDERELVQAMLNLLINACDAVKASAAPRIDVVGRSVVGEDGQDEAEVVVRDNGHGMTADVRERIFDLFFTTKPGQQGTGLGLGVVHGIVTGHEGTITVRSEPEAGSEFVVILPSAGAERYHDGDVRASGSDEGFVDSDEET